MKESEIVIHLSALPSITTNVRSELQRIHTGYKPFKKIHAKEQFQETRMMDKPFSDYRCSSKYVGLYSGQGFQNSA